MSLTLTQARKVLDENYGKDAWSVAKDSKHGYYVYDCIGTYKYQDDSMLSGMFNKTPEDAIFDAAAYL